MDHLLRPPAFQLCNFGTRARCSRNGVGRVHGAPKPFDKWLRRARETIHYYGTYGRWGSPSVEYIETRVIRVDISYCCTYTHTHPTARTASLNTTSISYKIYFRYNICAQGNRNNTHNMCVCIREHVCPGGESGVVPNFSSHTLFVLRALARTIFDGAVHDPPPRHHRPVAPSSSTYGRFVGL